MLLERILAPLAPRWALERAQARLAFEALRTYDGARTSRRTRNWNPTNAGPSAEVAAALSVLRARSRDLVRNNPYAAAGLDMLVAYQVGTGIVPRSATGDAALDKRADDLFAAWAAHADVAGRLDFWGLQAQVARSRAEAGEVLVMLVPLSAAEMRRAGSPVPLALQVIEADHLDDTRERSLTDGVLIRQGVEMDGNGRRLAYWLFDDHPGEPGGYIRARVATQSRRVSADEVLHVFRQDRPGQVRGVPDLASVMMRLRQLDEYEDAAVEQAKVQACLAAFVTSSAPVGRGPLEGAVDADSGERRKTFSPGMIEKLRPGEDVKFHSPSGSGGFSEFAKHQLRAVAAGFGLTYDLLTGDLSDANYSSLRAGRLAFKRRLEAAQWLMLVPQFCEPVWRAFIAAAQRVGALPQRDSGWPAVWGPPHFEMVDPLKDAEALRLMVRSGFVTWGQAVAELGWDARKQVAEIAEWNAAHDDAGLILDCDPRRTATTGGAQDVKQNAAIEIAATGAVAPPAAEPRPAAD